MAKKKKSQQPKRYPVHRLEQMLRVWEDRLWLLNFVYRACERTKRPTPRGIAIIDAIQHFASFRSYLLNYRSGPIDRRFTNGRNHLAAFCVFMDKFTQLPFVMASWMRNSRRVYRLTSDLQILLEHTHLEDICWNDVTWPFDSFHIELDCPIRDSKGHAYDAIQVSEMHRSIDEHKFGCGCIHCQDTNERWQIILLGNDLDRRRPIDETTKQQAEQELRKGRDAQIGKLLDRFDKRTPIHSWPYQQWNMLSRTRDGEKPITTSYSDIFNEHLAEVGNPTVVTQQEYSHIDRAIRIVVGLCMYLQMLPTGSPHKSEWQPVRRGTPNPNSITDTAEVCHVSSVHVLTPEERQVLTEHREGPRGYELCAHFRSGHWRRPPGKGDDPTAPKTVWVRPTLVRRDRLGPGELPGGAQSDAL